MKTYGPTYDGDMVTREGEEYPHGAQKEWLPFDSPLMTKLACVVYYLQQVRANRRESNVLGMNSILDDIELNDWIIEMNKRNLIGTRL